MMIHTLISTVGTSLIEGNLRKLDASAGHGPHNRQALRKALEERDWKGLAEELSRLDPSERVCGAEINTVHELTTTVLQNLSRVEFLVSSTDDGVSTGEILTRYFRGRGSIREAGYRQIEGLSDSDPARFKNTGLRNLARAIGELVRAWGAGNTAIDATGGYKAQIAVALLIGQSLNIPVYYKHERFSQIIDFPPMPVSLDFSMFAAHADLFSRLEKGDIIPVDELDRESGRIRIFLNEEEIDGSIHLELSAVGQIYIESFRTRYPARGKLTDSLNRNGVKLTSHHYAEGAEAFVHKIYAENLWISRIDSMDYGGQKGMKAIGFHVKDTGAGEQRLICVYTDKNSFSNRFWIHLDDESLENLTCAADELNSKYG